MTSLVRRNTRLRREYLYRRSLQGKEREVYEKKRLIKQALNEGKPLPTELRKEGRELKLSADLDDARTSELKSMLDDEYSLAGMYDPKILITTSRDPSSKLIQFVKELRLMFPNSQRINRGTAVIKDLVGACRAQEITDLIIVHEHRGQPDGLIVSHLPYGPTAFFGLSNVVLRHDIKSGMQAQGSSLDTVSEAYPHLIFHNFSTTLGQRTSNVLKYLFPVPKTDSKRVMSFVNRDDTISFRHHVYKKKDGTSGKAKDNIELEEIGPRFEMKLYHLKLATIEMADADTEWVLRPYMNSTKKRKVL